MSRWWEVWGRGGSAFLCGTLAALALQWLGVSLSDHRRELREKARDCFLRRTECPVGTREMLFENFPWEDKRCLCALPPKP